MNGEFCRWDETYGSLRHLHRIDSKISRCCPLYSCSNIQTFKLFQLHLAKGSTLISAWTTTWFTKYVFNVSFTCQNTHVTSGTYHCNWKWCLHGEPIIYLEGSAIFNIFQAMRVVEFIKHYGTQFQYDSQQLDSVWTSFLISHECPSATATDNYLYPLIQ